MFKFKRIMSMLLVLLVIQVVNVSALHVFAESVTDDVYTVQNDTAQELELPPLPSPTPSPADTIVYGDVNGDGMFNSIDFAYMRQYLLGMITDFPGNRGMEAADVDGSQGVNSIDFAYMRQYLLGIIDEFPVTANQYRRLETDVIYVNDEVAQLQSPIYVKGTSYFMSLRDISQSFCLTVEWDSVSQEMIISDSQNRLTLSANSNQYTLNGNVYHTDIPAAIIDSRTYVPIQIILDCFECTLTEDETKVQISYISPEGVTTNVTIPKSAQPTPMATPTPTATVTVTVTPTPTLTVTVTVTPTPTLTVTSTPTPSSTPNFSQVRPSNIDVSLTGIDGVYISWDPVDGAGSYEIFRDGVTIGITSSADYTDSSIMEGIDYTYYITAANEEGISSQQSEKVIVNIGDATIDTDTTLNENRFYGSLNLEGGALLNLNGYKLSVFSVYNQSFGETNVNGGRLEVLGDYSIGQDGVIFMTNDADYVYVGGNFTCISSYDHVGFLEAGIIEIKGNYTGFFMPTGTHKVVLSGSNMQVVNGENYVRFSELEVRNESGVRFDLPIVLGTMKGNYKVIGTMIIESVFLPISGDVVVDGDLELRGEAIDLSGNSFVVKGNLTQSGYSRINVNGGRLEVQGDYNMKANEFGESDAKLQMTNDADYVYVEGDFTTFGSYGFNYDFIAGVLEIKGNLTTNKSGFESAGRHKVIFSGSTVQIVSSNDEYVGGIMFGELEIRNESGVRFDSPITLGTMKGNYKVMGPMIVNYVVMPISGDVVIDGDFEISGDWLDLAGYRFEVRGNLTQSDYCKINVNKGRLEVQGDYTMMSYNSYNTMLQMTNDEDYVRVGGNFTTDCIDMYNDNDYLTAGELEIKGNLIINNGRFESVGRHKVVLSGSTVQIVSSKDEYVSEIMFGELEIRNESGVQFDLPITLGTMKGNYKVVGPMIVNYVVMPVSGDVQIDGDFELRGGGLNLAGYRFEVRGNLTQSGYCKIIVNKGSLEVQGDYTIMSYGYNGPNTILEMKNDTDYVYVGGDFSIDDSYGLSEYLTAGVLEVKGNFTSAGFFQPSGTHKVVLSGSNIQVVGNAEIQMITFNELEIRNESGVRFDSPIVLGTMKGNYKVIGTMLIDVIRMPVSGDVVINGDVELRGPINLAGHRFEVNGNLTHTEYNCFPSKINISGGRLEVQGDYSMTSGTILQMKNDADYVYVGGNFATNSTTDHRFYLTVGTMEVKGDFTQAGNYANFNPSGTHRVILSGDSVQTVTFEDPTLSSFNILEITKPIETGYIFNATPVWKTLEERVGV